MSAARSFSRWVLAGTALAVLVLAAARSSSSANGELRWRAFATLPGVVDVAGPRSDGSLVVAARAGLFLLRPDHKLIPFARGPHGYVPPAGEPYITITTQQRLPGAACSFKRDDVYALRPGPDPGVTVIDRTGRSRAFADLPVGSFPSSVAFDTVGTFGHRLLVTTVLSERTTLHQIDCRGRATTVVNGAPKVEGGAAVAPKGFGRFSGRLVAVDELTGAIWAFGPRGAFSRLAKPPLPVGADLGLEGLGFAPRDFGSGRAAFLADIAAPGSPTEGTDKLLTLPARPLALAGVRAGDLLVSTEGGGITLAVRCRQNCRVRRVARAFPATHDEGHIRFGVPRR